MAVHSWAVGQRETSSDSSRGSFEVLKFLERLHRTVTLYLEIRSIFYNTLHCAVLFCNTHGCGVDFSDIYLCTVELQSI